MQWNINRPWASLDEWQKKYIFETGPDENCFLLCGRQVGKTTAMSIKAVELCLNKFQKGENVLICSITEKQGYHLLAKCLAYAEERYKGKVKRGKDRPTMHRINFTNGTSILSFASGETGEGLRGFTIKKLLIDEGSRMSEEFFIAVNPMLSVIKGSMDIASTPCGKQGYFYECSKDDNFTKFYVSAEDCPRHSQNFLEQQKKRLSKLAYAQEYLAIFTDELKRIFPEELLKRVCIGKREKIISKQDKYYIGVDVAGMGEDECTYEIIKKTKSKLLFQVENIIEKRNYTTDTSRKIINLNRAYNFNKIGIDDGGVGFGVFSELINDNRTKRKTIALNNASRVADQKEEKNTKLLKEEMYFNLLRLMEQEKIILLDDDELIASLSSMQYELVSKKAEKTKLRIFGSYSHIAEGIVRAAWLASNSKDLNIYFYS